MKLFSTFIILLFCFQSTTAQSTWHPGSFNAPTLHGISSYYNNRFPNHHSSFSNPERAKEMKRYRAEYKKAFSGSLSLGYNQFEGDLTGQNSDGFPQMNINACINKRLSPNFSFKAIMSLGGYETKGFNANPNIYTGDTPSQYNSGDFMNSESKGSYASFCLMTRRKISFSRVKSIHDEKKFGCFLSWGVGYLSSHVLLKSIQDEDIRLSRNVSNFLMPIMLDFSYVIKNNLGAMVSFDLYMLENDNLDLIRSGNMPDYITNIRTGLFFKIDN